MNYVDDINTTLRRISGSIPLMTDEERKRLGDYMRKAVSNMEEAIKKVEQTK
jgi:uncharacterized protein Yka (UPF0111/DUF47 family)